MLLGLVQSPLLVPGVPVRHARAIGLHPSCANLLLLALTSADWLRQITPYTFLVRDVFGDGNVPGMLVVVFEVFVDIVVVAGRNRWLSQRRGMGSIGC